MPDLRYAESKLKPLVLVQSGSIVAVYSRNALRKAVAVAKGRAFLFGKPVTIYEVDVRFAAPREGARARPTVGRWVQIAHEEPPKRWDGSRPPPEPRRRTSRKRPA
jgi:hypothetical protein